MKKAIFFFFTSWEGRGGRRKIKVLIETAVIYKSILRTATTITTRDAIKNTNMKYGDLFKW